MVPFRWEIRGNTHSTSISSKFGIILEILNWFFKKNIVFPQYQDTQAKHQQRNFQAYVLNFEYNQTM